MATAEEKFARKMQRAFRADGRDCTYDADAFALRFEDDAVVNLANLFAEYQRAGFFQRRRMLRHFQAALRLDQMKVPDSYADAAPDLLPRVRDATYYPIAKLHCELNGMPLLVPPVKEVAGELAIELCYDTETAIASITDEQLATWGMTFDEVYRDSCTNLRARSSRRFEELVPGLYVSPWQDCHDASRLTLLGLIHHQRVRGEHLAMVPNRDTLLICGSDDVDAQAAMLTIASETIDHPRRISGAAFMLAPGGWDRYTPPDDHPLAALYREVYARSRGADYSQQHGLLEALHQRDGVDLFVPEVNAVSDEQGRMMTLSIWVRDCELLLPCADLIAFAGEDVAAFTARWDTVVEVAGDLLEPTELRPRRWRVRGFPDADQLDELRRNAIELPGG